VVLVRISLIMSLIFAVVMVWAKDAQPISMNVS
jgi:hypothetical protein